MIYNHLKRKRSESLLSNSPSPQWRSDIHRVSSGRRRFVEFCFTVATVLGVFYLLKLHIRYRQDLKAKYTPTLFNAASQWKVSNYPWQMSDDGSGGGHETFDHREEWKRIGSGWEGEIFMYNDTVIKTFVTSRSPLRNCLEFAQTPTRIPTEILATVWLGGLKVEIDKATQFMPVHDYFRTPATVTTPASWHLLTPFLESGSLKDLANRLRPLGLTFRELDLRFRSSLHRLLDALETMHSEHKLCHDDIKPGNTFIAGTTSPVPGDSQADDDDTDLTHWLLADFGNVREVDHPYHSSLIWIVDSHQHRDCRVNDAVRLIKTYLGFLRTASMENDSVSFDKAFWSGVEPWSELYWSALQDPLSGHEAAKSMREKSESLPPVVSENTTVVNHVGSRGRKCLPGHLRRVQNTENELNQGMWVTEDRARFFAGTAVFGVPRGNC